MELSERISDAYLDGFQIETMLSLDGNLGEKLQNELEN